MTSPDALEAKIRDVLREHGRLNKPIEQIDTVSDLYQAGMTSHASVNVMLALESKFDVEFADHMLKRSVFASVAAIRDAVSELTQASRMQ
ncbi:MAG: acyl carrier protein [Rhizobacter sp.]